MSYQRQATLHQRAVLVSSNYKTIFAIKRQGPICLALPPSEAGPPLHPIVQPNGEQRTDALQWVKQLWPLPGRPHKIEWHQGELYPRVGFIVTNLTRPAERVSKFYNGRGTAEQYIKEGKLALRWTRLSCHAFRH